MEGGHYGGETTTYKFMRDGYYCLTLFKYSHTYVHKFPSYQRFVSHDRKSPSPLLPVSIQEPFQKWGLDVITDIFPNSSKKHSYILTAIDYFTQWSKEVLLRQVNDQEVIHFLQHNI